MNFLRNFFSNRVNVILTVVLLVILIGVGGLSYKFLSKSPTPKAFEEVELQFDPEGPYAILEPRRDGNAIVLNFRRVASYDAFSYEIVYESEGIDRGAGSLDTYIELKDKKSEYSQEILFGTCSKGDTFSTLHCVFDKNVENGTLSLNIRDSKNGKIYKMVARWHLQKPDVALGVITSADGNFTYKSEAKKDELSLVGYTLVNELTGVPKLPDGKRVFGKVYALNIPTARNLPKGIVSMETAENPLSSAKVYRYLESENSWKELNTKVEGSKLTAPAEGAGIFAVLVDSK